MVKKGYKHTKKARRKMSKARMGHIVTEETREKISKANMGHIVTEEARRKIGKAQEGNKNRVGLKHTKKTKRKMSKSQKGNKNRVGKKHTSETKKKLSKAQMGEKNYHFGKTGEESFNWKGGIMMSDGYKLLYIESGKYALEHRLVWEKHNGKIPKGKIIHHINGNKLDNKIGNLRIMTQSEHVVLHTKLRIKR